MSDYEYVRQQIERQEALRKLADCRRILDAADCYHLYTVDLAREQIRILSAKLERHYSF